MPLGRALLSTPWDEVPPSLGRLLRHEGVMLGWKKDEPELPTPPFPNGPILFPDKTILLTPPNRTENIPSLLYAILWAFYLLRDDRASGWMERGSAALGDSRLDTLDMPESELHQSYCRFDAAVADEDTLLPLERSADADLLGCILHRHYLRNHLFLEILWEADHFARRWLDRLNIEAPSIAYREEDVAASFLAFLYSCVRLWNRGKSGAIRLGTLEQQKAAYSQSTPGLEWISNTLYRGRFSPLVDLDQCSEGLLALLDAREEQFIAAVTRHIVHRPSCRSVSTISSRNRRFFPSLEIASAEGYRPCRRCCP